jgi:hypothetical protein
MHILGKHTYDRTLTVSVVVKMQGNAPFILVPKKKCAPPMATTTIAF